VMIGCPFALSLSKGLAWHSLGFDRLSPSGSHGSNAPRRVR